MSTKAVRVNRYLQLPDYPHIFAGGDVTDVREEKTAQNAERHARIIAKNILRLGHKPLVAYRQRPTPLVISLGEGQGIVSWRGMSIDGWLPGALKKLVRWWALHGYR